MAAKAASLKKVSKPSTKELSSKKALLNKKILSKATRPSQTKDSSRVLTAEGWNRRH
ncbi:MAG: hypothetical protein HYZ47_03460 [Simkania negevensis]|nr:hypothetical protein [Simkania negevensis]